ncbi:MAG: YmdB family metallophosphoesterase [Ruminococcaceae bacterium]|nr:YmdB family metallophosphoesterase [Oscillospiraceae bacterium]
MLNSTLKILTIGDIVGPEATDYLCSKLWKLREETEADLVVANGENASAGNGIDPASADSLFKAGVDVITGGNHSWQKKAIYSYIENCSSLLRPANYPGRDPGNGHVIKEAKGYRILVMNIMGTVFMEPLANPFDTADRILAEEKGKYDIAVLDIHAEATSEKIALANYLDGRVNLVFGTHTHVPTADLKILKGGTGYVTDLGMCGPRDSVLGIRPEIIIERFRTKMPGRFDLAQGELETGAALFTLDPSSGRTLNIERIYF